MAVYLSIRRKSVFLCQYHTSRHNGYQSCIESLILRGRGLKTKNDRLSFHKTLCLYHEICILIHDIVKKMGNPSQSPPPIPSLSAYFFNNNVSFYCIKLPLGQNSLSMSLFKDICKSNFLIQLMSSSHLGLKNESITLFFMQKKL